MNRMLVGLTLALLFAPFAVGADSPARKSEGVETPGAGALVAVLIGNDGKEELPVVKKGVTITLHFPGKTPSVDVRKVLDGLKPLKVNGTMIAQPEAGQGTHASIVATPGTPSKEVAAVVAALLELGINKIAIEARK